MFVDPHYYLPQTIKVDGKAQNTIKVSSPRGKVDVCYLDTLCLHTDVESVHLIQPLAHVTWLDLKSQPLKPNNREPHCDKC